MALDLTSLRPSPLLLRGLVLCALGLGIGYLLRYQVIEPRSMGQTCGGIGTPWWCPLRTGLIKAHEWYLYGGAALLLALTAWFRTDARWAAAALGCAGIGLLVYNTEVAALGLLIALLKLIRA